MTVAHIIMIFLMIVLVEMKKLYTGRKCWNRVSPYLWPNYQINMHMRRLEMWVFQRYTSCCQEFIIHFSFATCKEIKSLCLKQENTLFSSGRGVIANLENNQWLNSNSNNIENCMTYFYLNLLDDFPFFAYNETSSISLWCSISLAVLLFPQDGGVKFPPYSLAETPGANSDYYETFFDQFQNQGPLGVDSSLTVVQKQKFTIRAVSPEYCYSTETTKVCAF